MAAIHSPSSRPSQKAVDDFCEAAGNDDHSGILKFLDQYGTVYIDRPHKYGDTALIWAAFNGSIDAVQLLLEKGAFIDAKSEITKKTAYTLAVESGYPEIAALIQEWPAVLKKRQEDAKKKKEHDKRGAALYAFRIQKLRQRMPQKSVFRSNRAFTKK